MTTRFEAFNKRFFSVAQGYNTHNVEDIKWFDKKGAYRLDNVTVVTIELIEHGRSRDDYCGYLVRIVNKIHGEIDRHYFDFNTYLKERVDKRLDMPTDFHVNGNIPDNNGNAQWYISTPSEKEMSAMIDRIFNYIMSWYQPELDGVN